MGSCVPGAGRDCRDAGETSAEHGENRRSRERGHSRIQSFGVPLDAEDRQVAVGDGFHALIRRTVLADQQVVAELQQTLMVAGIDRYVARRKDACDGRDGIRRKTDGMIEISVRGLMQMGGGHILQERTAEGDVEQLHAFTDTQNWFAGLDTEFQRLKLQDIQFDINVYGAFVAHAVEARRDVSTARQQETVAATDVLRTECRMGDKTVFREETRIVGDVFGPSQNCNFHKIRPGMKDIV